MKVSIVIPIRNEELVLEKIIEQLENKLKNLPYEIVFINDFSTDNTFLKAQGLIVNKKQINLYNNNRKGLGGAIWHSCLSHPVSGPDHLLFNPIYYFFL